MKKTTFVILLLIVSSLIAHAQVITVENIWKEYQFAPRGVRGYTSLPDGEHYATVSTSGVDSYSFKTGEKTATLLDADALKNAVPKALQLKDIHDFSFSQDGNKMLIATQLESIYRRSSKAYYYIYNTKDKSVTPLSNLDLNQQSFATFSHDGNKVAFVRDNNIFYKDLIKNIEIQVTKDGKINHILNGMADWVYEEELDMAQCFSWSPNDTKIAYLHFDESAVKEFSMTEYGDLYPTEYRYKYPKAGEDNSKVEVHLFDCNNNTDITIDVTCEDCYIPRIYWQSNATELIILRLNRHQNQLDFIRYNVSDKTQQVVFTDKNEKWLDVSNHYHFLDDNKTLFLCSEQSGYNHIYKVTLGETSTQITSGNWEVAEICAVDKAKKLIYYLSNESGQLNRDLYVIDFSGKNKKMLTSGDGWNSPDFSEKAHYYLNSYSNLNTPPVYSLRESNGKELRVLESNETLLKKMKLYPFAPRTFFTFTTSENIQLNGWMMKPNNCDTTQKYPVLMFVYGGPGSQEVQNSYRGAFDIAWYQLLAQKGYIIVCVDGRGTAGRGDAFKKCVYQQMGKYEALDQIEAAKYLKTLSYIDTARIGIWGWSFGGYLSALTKFTSGNLFKMAMSVAPVTNWRYYDNIYTERFQRTPQENPAGYDENSPITYASRLEGKYLLVHGTADDNVHFQNSMDLANALIQGNKQFEQFFYPNKNHFIMGGNTRCHLYNKLTNFVLENL
ncbi:MAG: S9 family peptidase [Bacteroidales bacterium]|jgi:dipeptidyl-peptidase-4|nr:S9 family peptidase [Bacteroidales bacterium]